MQLKTTAIMFRKIDMKNFVLKPDRQELLKKRFEENKIAALNDHSAFLLKNHHREYCLYGAILTDEEIEERATTNSDKRYHEIMDSPFSENPYPSEGAYERIWSHHDKYINNADKAPLVELIKTAIETGEIPPSF